MKATKTIPVITLLLALVALGGCKTYIHFRYGISPPKPETPESLLKFLARHDYPAGRQYLFADSGSYFAAMRHPMFRKNLLGTMIFDSSGRLIMRDTARCQWAGYDRIANLSRDSTYPITEELTLGFLLPRIRPFGPGRSPGDTLAAPGFTVLINWGKFMGTVNGRLFSQEKAVDGNPKARIRLIWLNADMQESWNLPREQRMELR